MAPTPASDAAAERLVRYALRRRGIRCGPSRHLGALVPRSARGRDALYELLKHYSFRLFLRDLIRARRGARAAELTHYCSLPTAQRYLLHLRGMGLVRTTAGGRFRLRRHGIHSFGPTLEWFVARSLQREFGIPTAWGLRPGGTGGGGDYDVVGLADGALIYVEVKSSAPRNIEPPQIAAFVERVLGLAPDVAILLNDTQLRMLDKLVPALRAALRRHRLGGSAIRRVHGEIFSRADRWFVTNSEPDLIGNLGVCLARFFRARAGSSTSVRACQAARKRTTASPTSRS
jgi:hypothetical protein